VVGILKLIPSEGLEEEEGAASRYSNWEQDEGAEVSTGHMGGIWGSGSDSEDGGSSSDSEDGGSSSDSEDGGSSSGAGAVPLVIPSSPIA
jgi:hypothetical protein